MPGSDGSSFAERIDEIPGVEVDILPMVRGAWKADRVTRNEGAGAPVVLLKPVMWFELLEAMIGVRMSSPSSVVREERAEREQLNVLVVEDSLINQKLAAAILREQEHYVVVANNGREALEILETRAFDLILMDIQMPEMDGIEATRAIRVRERECDTHTPIIAVTAHALKGDRERCLEAGMDGYLAKPIDSGRLREAIETVMRTVP
jgi:CheY-like chemotaxis protein